MQVNFQTNITKPKALTAFKHTAIEMLKL